MISDLIIVIKMRYSVGQVQDNLWEVIQGSFNNFLDRITMTTQKKREIFENWYKGNNPEDVIVRHLGYHDVFSMQKQNIAIAADGQRSMWYVVDQSTHPFISATGGT